MSWERAVRTLHHIHQERLSILELTLVWVLAAELSSDVDSRRKRHLVVLIDGFLDL